MDTLISFFKAQEKDKSSVTLIVSGVVISGTFVSHENGLITIYGASVSGINISKGKITIPVTNVLAWGEGPASVK